MPVQVLRRACSPSGRGTLRANGGVTNNGQMQFSGGFTDVYGAVTSSSGSKITVTGGGTSTFYNNVTMQSGSTFQVSTASTVSVIQSATRIALGFDLTRSITIAPLYNPVASTTQ